MGSNHKDAYAGEFTMTKHMQLQNTPGEEEQDPYVHMSPSGTSSGTTSHKAPQSYNSMGAQNSGNTVSRRIRHSPSTCST